eukprot:SAG31_NODE_13329_length_876_cov_1.449163_2_plen_45_part_01
MHGLSRSAGMRYMYTSTKVPAGTAVSIMRMQQYMYGRARYASTRE